MNRMQRSPLKLVVAALAAMLLSAACAPSVTVRSDTDPGVDMSQYRSYNFFSQMGIEGDEYSSLLGQHFRDAISEQMDARGYVKSDNPQLQVNVSIGSQEKVSVNTYQDPYLYGGYYGRRGAGYWGSPFYYGGTTQTSVRQYTEANVYVDLVDASTHKMVWQGVATFTLTDKMREQLRQTIFSTVDKIFAKYPVAPVASG
ncbi:MAG: DUF4136 domain-containing protein [Lysobacterales bacterium]|jgi:hypothetical protein